MTKKVQILDITLKTLAIGLVSAQDVFDRVVHHLLTQNEKSMIVINSKNVKYECLYRNGGLKCAAGCLIGDDEYVRLMEGFSWRDLINRKLVPDTHSLLIEKLQNIHDSVDVSNWKKSLIKLAESEQLEWKFNQ